MRRLIQVIRVVCFLIALAAVGAAVVWQRYPDVLSDWDAKSLANYGKDDRARIDALRERSRTEPEAALEGLAQMCSELSHKKRLDRLFGLRLHAVLVYEEVATALGQHERAARQLLAFLDDHPNDLGLVIKANTHLIQSAKGPLVEEGRLGLAELCRRYPSISTVVRAHVDELWRQGRSDEIVRVLDRHLSHFDSARQASQGVERAWKFSWSDSLEGKGSNPKSVEPLLQGDRISFPLAPSEGKRVLHVQLPTYCMAELADLRLNVFAGGVHHSFGVGDLQRRPESAIGADGSFPIRSSLSQRFAVEVPADLGGPVMAAQLSFTMERLPSWLWRFLDTEIGEALIARAAGRGDDLQAELVRLERARIAAQAPVENR